MNEFAEEVERIKCHHAQYEQQITLLRSTINRLQSEIAEKTSHQAALADYMDACARQTGCAAAEAFSASRSLAGLADSAAAATAAADAATAGAARAQATYLRSVDRIMSFCDQFLGDSGPWEQAGQRLDAAQTLLAQRDELLGRERQRSEDMMREIGEVQREMASTRTQITECEALAAKATAEYERQSQELRALTDRATAAEAEIRRRRAAASDSECMELAARLSRLQGSVAGVRQALAEARASKTSFMRTGRKQPEPLPLQPPLPPRPPLPPLPLPLPPRPPAKTGMNSEFSY